MAKPYNRSPWVVKLPGTEPRKFRLKSAAQRFLKDNGYLDLDKLPRGALKQLETAYEVQIIRKDKAGKVVRRNETFDTYAEAEKFAAHQHAELGQILKTHGGFEVGFETITVKDVLEKFYVEHFTDKRSFKEIGYRIPYLAEWLGANRKFRELTTKDFKRLRKTFEDAKFSASHQRNYFTILTSLYKHAAREWDYPVANLASGIKLSRPSNYIQRDWEGDEKQRLMTSLQLHSPWMIPIVQLSLEMAFRRGELVQSAKNKVTGAQNGGLMWNHIDWERKELRIDIEKNDRSKPASESKGRSVPLTAEMRKILFPIYESSSSKNGLVFQATVHSVSGAFSLACKKADPPIEKLTFHSLRKIATKALSMRVKNAMQLRRLSGHKNMEVLDKRYYGIGVEELGAQLLESSGSIKQRGIAALIKVLGLNDAKEFLREVRHAENADDIFS